MPKFLVNATGDQFFLPDSWRFYLADLPGETHVRYVPNADHGLKDTDALSSVAAFYGAILTGTPRPDVTWEAGKDGRIRVRSKATPTSVTAWRATNPAARDFRLETLGPVWQGTPLEPVAPGVWETAHRRPAGRLERRPDRDALPERLEVSLRVHVRRRCRPRPPAACFSTTHRTGARSGPHATPALMTETFTIGIDFGTESGRAVVVRVRDGAELASAVTPYPDGVIDQTLPGTSTRLGDEWALQNPLDYLHVLKTAVPEAVRASGVDPRAVAGVAIDFTACTMLPVKGDGTPLMALPEFRGNPHAWVKLWKHHAAQPHADRVTATAAARGETWLPRYGGKISSEWFLAKALQILEEAPEIYRAADRLIEACRLGDLADVRRRDAQHLHRRLQGQLPGRRLPDVRLPRRAQPRLRRSRRVEAVDHAVAARRPRRRSDRRSGRLDGPAGGDRGRRRQRRRARHGAGGRRRRAGTAGRHHGHVDVPHAARRSPHRSARHVRRRGRRHHPRPLRLRGRPERRRRHLRVVREARRAQPPYGGGAGAGAAHEALEREAAAQKPGEHGLLALDWWNGNRSVLVDANLSGLLIGMTLATRAPDIYRALIEATAYGTRLIIENFERCGVPVRELVIAGGLQKNKLLMQIYADVTGRPLSLVDSEQGPALGSAMHAAVAAGLYPTIADAAARMGRIRRNVYTPDPAAARAYDGLYADYVVLHDYFGRGANDVMKRLKGAGASR